MVDSGVRKAELVDLNWADVDLRTGVVLIKRGKGGKSRNVVIGAMTRRALVAYGRTSGISSNAPLFAIQDGGRLTTSGLRSMMERISKRCGIHVSPHALRRTFATLSLRAGMNPLHLQGLLGHTTLEMTRRYTQIVDDDLVAAYKEHGPIDNFLKN
jgi:site-specific recombinase XerD